MELTIFTPTYNRVTELLGLSESICNALSYLTETHSIEWLIVDDGSFADVSSVVDKLPKVKGLTINFHRKVNGGKHTAFNYAIEHAQGELFVCIDDDDRLTEEALYYIFKLYKELNPIRKEMCLGAFVGRVVDEKGNILGSALSKYPTISDTIEIRDKYHYWGEPEVYFTDILKRYRFDVFEGENFLTEAYLFDVMSKQYNFYYINYPLMVKKYLPGGLTDNQTIIRVKNPRGAEQYYYQRWILCTGIKNRLKAAINCNRFSWWCRGTKKRRNMGWYGFISLPVSILMYVNDRKQLRVYCEKKNNSEA